MSRSAGKKPQSAAALNGVAAAPLQSLPPSRPGAKRPAKKHAASAPNAEQQWQDTLLDGTHVLIRPIRKSDTELERDFITHLSPGTRRMRILGQMNEPSDDLLRCLTDIDYRHDMAFVALVHRDGETQEVGVSRYGTSIDGKSCECAVTVSDAWRHRGLATALMRHLVDHARTSGIRKMVSFDSAQNVEMRELAQFLGFERKPDPRDATMVVHTLKLDDRAVLDLLVHCHDFVEFSSGPRYAATLAGALGASLTGMYVAPPLPLPRTEDERSGLAAEYLAYAHEELERARSVQPDFARWSARFGAHSAHWQLAIGDTTEALVAACDCADLLVIEHRARVPDDSLPAIARTLLSGATCIVVPENELHAKPAWERIAIAWNGTIGAVRAVHAALPLLRMATEIHLLTLPAPAGRPGQRPLPEFAIERYLDQHSIGAKWHSIPAGQQSVDQAILVESSRLAIDLLVMGAFGTTRLHTDHLRGITARVLQQSLLPVFVRH